KTRTRGHITVASLNMRGFGDIRGGQASEKWWSLNQVIRDERIAILALQETHLTEERVDALNTLFRATMRVVACLDRDNPTGARGIAFAINRRLVDADAAVLLPIKEGRAAILQVPWTRNKTLKLLNVYAPNDMRDNAEFWGDVRETIANRRYGRVDALLGDFNMVEDAQDRMPPHRDLQEAVDELKIRLDLVDGWRERAPRKKAFSFFQRATGSQSRIDRIYLTRELMGQANEWDIRGPGILTDHRLVTVSLANTDTPYVGKGRWAIPHSIVSDTKFLGELHELGMKLQTQLDSMGERSKESNPQIMYAQFKRHLMAAAKLRAKQSVPRIEQRIAALKEDIAARLNGGDVSAEDVKNDVAIMQERLIELELRRFGRKQLVVAVNDWAQGETVCKYWTKLNATPHPS
ncbi:Endonuclease/exonuclease/phosphatase, partial [Cerioporus squamosus]